jgi:hypothetical protein
VAVTQPTHIRLFGYDEITTSAHLCKCHAYFHIKILIEEHMCKRTHSSLKTSYQTLSNSIDETTVFARDAPHIFPSVHRSFL